MQGTLTIIVLGILAFIGFCIYFIFKILEFVIRAINLYERIITREDVIIKLLIDIRDNTKSVDSDDWVEKPIEDSEEAEEDSYGEHELNEPDEVQDDFENQEEEKGLAELQFEEERNEEAYYRIRENIFHELKNELKTDQEISILKSMSSLTYNDLKKLESKPKDLSNTGIKVLQLIIARIAQHKNLMDESST